MHPVFSAGSTQRRRRMITTDLAWYIDAITPRGFRDADPGQQSDASAAASLNARLKHALRVPAEADAIVDFWREAGPAHWFAKEPEFDRQFSERYFLMHEAAARGDLMGWMSWPAASLALLLLLDQFPRNAFRGTPRMYATDGLARELADAAIEAG